MHERGGVPQLDIYQYLAIRIVFYELYLKII